VCRTQAVATRPAPPKRRRNTPRETRRTDPRLKPLSSPKHLHADPTGYACGR
jgi:hypothetical protein